MRLGTHSKGRGAHCGVSHVGPEKKSALTGNRNRKAKLHNLVISWQLLKGVESFIAANISRGAVQILSLLQDGTLSREP